MAGRVSSPEIIGRAAERERVAALLDDADAGRPRLLLLGGEAGIGKSRLLREAADEARRRGFIVLEGATVGLGEAALPFGPIVEALRGLARELDRAEVERLASPATAEVGRLVPELGLGGPREPSTLVQPEWLQLRIFESTLGLLAAATASAPVALLLEDLHWADGSTRDLLAFLARALRDERLFVLATFRSDELHRRHPLRPWLAELERTPRVERLELARFDRSQVAAQLAAILEDEPAPDELVAAIHLRSDGNPFFVEELLAVRASGDPGARMPLPSSIADALLARVGSLDETAQSVVAVASVAGRRVEHDLLVAATERPEPDVEAALRAAIGASILQPDPDADVPAYAFRHALGREAVLDDLLPSERRRLHARFAELLEARALPAGGGAAGRLTEIAHHWRHAHVQPRALRAALRAAEAAAASFAFAEAGRLYEQAIELWDVVPASERPDGHDLPGVLFAASFPLSFSGSSARGAALVRRAIELLGDGDPVRGAAYRTFLGRLEWVAGDGPAAVEALEGALALLPETPSRERADALAGLAGVWMLLGRHGRATGLAETAIEVARAVGDRRIEGNAMNTLGTSLAVGGDAQRSIELLEEAMRIAREVADPSDIGRAYSNLPSALQLAGELERALELSIEGSAAAHELGTWRTFGIFHDANTLSLLLDLGRWDEARAKATRIAPLAVDGSTRLNAGIATATLRARSGELAEARRLLDEVLPQLERMSDAQFTAPAFGALVELELAAGRLDEAVAAGAEGARRLAATEDVGLLGAILATALRAVADRVLRARAERDAEAERRAMVGGRDLERLFRDRVASITGRHVADLPAWVATAEAELGRLEPIAEPGRWAAAAEAWERLRRPYPAAYARYREGEAILEGRGDRDAAARALSTAAEVAGRLGAAPLRDAVRDLARRARLELAAPERPRDDPASDEGGRRAVDPTGDDRAVDAGASSGASQPGDARDPLAALGLTGREREVLAMLAAGFTNRRIAEALFISESTAGVHVSNILGKLGAANRVEAAATAARLGVQPHADDGPDVLDTRDPEAPVNRPR